MLSLLLSLESFAPPDDEARNARLFAANLDVIATLVAGHPDGFYVPLGRSPAPLQAILEELEPANVRGLPLSVRDGTGAVLRYPLSRAARRRVNEIFEHSLPTAE